MDVVTRGATCLSDFVRVGRVIEVVEGDDEMGVRTINIGEALGDADDLVIQLDVSRIR